MSSSSPESFHRVFTTAVHLLSATADPFRLPKSSLLSTHPNSQTIVQPTPVSASKIALPSLDFSHRQAGQTWPGTHVSQGAIIPPTTTLPTPPSIESDHYKSEKREDPYNMAAVLPPHAAMMSTPASHGGSSLTSRRTATNNLPGPLELPVNTLAAKFGGPLSSSSLPTVANGQQSHSNISALLTPPSNIPGESLSPMSSGSASASNPAAIGLPPYTPTGYWSHHGGSGSTPQQQPTTLAQSWNSNATAFNSTRGRFSPSLTSIMKNGTSGSPSEQLPPPSYDLGALPPFPNSLGQPGAISPSASNQHQHGMNFSIPHSASVSLPSQTSPINAPDPYLQKLPPTPNYYPHSQPSMTQQSQYPQYPSQSPSVQSPMSMPTPSSRISPINQPIQQFARSSYSAHGMSGPVLSNMHSPTGQMPMGGHGGMVQIPFNSGHAAQMPHMYGPQPGQQSVDRPFKCDQCPQSFNRNHDLKRHKRIHLAVKPFPCGHCDKSFSRKDALKVSIHSHPSYVCLCLTYLYRGTFSSKAAARPVQTISRVLRMRRISAPANQARSAIRSIELFN